jgi:DNA-binding GntR family transcriptional regulator
MIAETRMRMPAAPLTQWSQPGWIEDSARHHHAMVDALEAGDQQAFAAVVRAHIRAPQRPELSPQLPALNHRRDVTDASSAD